jgi:hypothetical protein
MTPENWLRLDEIENAIDNLAMCHRFLAEIQAPIRWKWAIMALHQALYSFAICAVRGTDSLSVLTRPDDHNSYLISIHEALSRAKSSRFLWPGATPLVTTDPENVALERLGNEFRNGFEHFRPQGWSIEVTGMPDLFRHALRVLRHLAVESQSVRYETDEQRTRVTETLGAIRATL